MRNRPVPKRQIETQEELNYPRTLLSRTRSLGCRIQDDDATEPDADTFDLVADLNEIFLRLLQASTRAIGVERSAKAHGLSPEAVVRACEIAQQPDTCAQVAGEPFAFASFRPGAPPIIASPLPPAEDAPAREARNLQLQLQAVLVMLIRTASDPLLVEVILGLTPLQVQQRDDLLLRWPLWLVSTRPWTTTTPLCERRLLAPRWSPLDRFEAIADLLKMRSGA
ncbi:conserved protein of unknown function (plasmid) [Rhodovastum atsumiense]|uniref:Uncharacterized protein n=1 Tax=Rhodovastum atsumiense TaxID=504468 RepID=A0A5M6IJT3_9PROT|nr:hypothetical protein [Rhodovastum atsumiense]KAA5608526.1 hypothetical protein F1189_28740 [Rhodovastum atsumiense]CAH2605804.1 conserved protein of unknown function [Rhodovastum atsumiense]